MDWPIQADGVRRVLHGHYGIGPPAKLGDFDDVVVMDLKTAAPAADRAGPSPGQPGPAAGFVALSRFVIANGMTAEVKAAFRDRPHSVDSAPGYQRMEVISPVDRPEEVWLLTFWTDEASFHTWHRSHEYHASHHGIPKGLKLVPGETYLRHFEHVGS